MRSPRSLRRSLGIPESPSRSRSPSPKKKRSAHWAKAKATLATQQRRREEPLKKEASPPPEPALMYKQKATRRPINVKLSDVNRPPWEVEMGIRGTYGLLMGKPKSLVRGKVSHLVLCRRALITSNRLAQSIAQRPTPPLPLARCSTRV